MRVGVGGGRRPPPASPREPPGRLRPRRHAERASPPAPFGAAAARPGPWVAGDGLGRGRGRRAGRLGWRRRRPEPSLLVGPAAPSCPSGGVAPAGPGEARAGEPSAAERDERGQSPPTRGKLRAGQSTAQAGGGPPLGSLYSKVRYRTRGSCPPAALRSTHTTSKAKNDRVVNPCGCSVELFLKGWRYSDLKMFHVKILGPESN